MCRRNCGIAAVPAPVTELPASSGGIPLDPQASLTALALRLEAAHEQDPGNAMVARELRATLMVIAGAGAPAEDDVDRIRREWEQVRDGR
jgi:hypothetical protein